MWEAVIQAIKSNPIAGLALLVSIAAFVLSWISFGKTRSATLYSDIDGRYMELLKLGITHPDFVNPSLTKEYKTKFHGDTLLKYQRYAFAAWNIVETIFDRRSIRAVRTTWDPVIKEENSLHRMWLNEKENKEKFKKKFLKFMLDNSKIFPCPQCEKEQPRCTRCVELQAFVESES